MSFLDDLIGGGSESKSRTFLDENQLPYLQDIWGNAQTLFNNGGSTVAAQTPQMLQYLQSAMNFGGNAGAMSGQAWDHGNSAFGVGDAGAGYIGTVLNGGGFSAPMQNGVNMNTVNSLIDNDLLNSQITASTRDIYRNLGENQMTGIASGAQLSGNAGSSRRGVAEAIAARGADDRAADVAAGIRSNAYSNAVNVAANQASANQGAQLNTNSLNANLGTNAFNSGFGQGYTGLNSGYNIGAGGVGVMGDAANTAQNYAQQVALAPWQALQLYQSSIGSPINQSETTQTTQGSPLGAIGGAVMGLGSLGWNPFGPTA